MTKATERLFSYGTLQNRKVQLETFGRELDGKPDALVGFKLENLTIHDEAVLSLSEQAVHPIAVRTGDMNDDVPGRVLFITEDELAAADSYEVDDYERVEAQLRSGGTAWVYVAKETV